MREVIFVQAKFPSHDKELAALFKRWDDYGLALRNNFRQQSISIFTPTQKFSNKEDYRYLTFMSETANFFVGLIHARRIIRSSGNSVTLVCGDNQISLLFALLLKIQLRKKIAIQTQFHGDIYTRKINPGVKGLIRTLFSRLAIQISDSIRIVSKFQEPEIRKLGRHIRANFVVSPIPIDYSKIPDPTEFQGVFDVALVGRLHAERGVSEAVSIIKALALIRPSLRVVIVGEGPERKSLEVSLEGEIAAGCVCFLGAVYGPELRNVFAQSEILLSTAPREGYGLTLREAALSGMTIVARDSLGTKEAARDFPTRFCLYSSEKEAVAGILNFLNSKNKLRDNSNLIAIQMETDKKNLARLLTSWVGD